MDQVEAEEDWENVEDINNLFINTEVDNKLCLVYQSYNIKELYQRYAPTLVLLDATYKVCKYSLPVYFLVAQTNVNYQVAEGCLCLNLRVVKQFACKKLWTPFKPFILLQII